MIKIKKVKKFDGVGMYSSLRRIKEFLNENANFSVELSDSERIIKLNIPFTEMYRKCSKEEWQKIKELIKKISIS